MQRLSRLPSHHAITVFVLPLLVAIAFPTVAQAEPKDAPPSPAPTKTRVFAGDNLSGLRGLARTVAATNNDAGYISLGTNLEFFSSSGFIRDGNTTTLYDHSRFDNTYTLAFAPLRFMEVSLGLHVISDNTSGTGGSLATRNDGLQVAIGDPKLALKGGYEVIPGLSVGGLADLRFASGTGFFEASFDSTVFSLAALASYQLPSLPLTFHLNAGFVIDGTKNLLDTTATTYNRFSAHMSSFNRVLLRIGAEYTTRYVGPFFEWSMEPFVGSGAPGVGDSPMRLTIGLHGWVGKHKGLQLMAGADIGLTGVGPRDANALGPDLYAFTIPRWNLVLRASYRFDPFHSDAPKVVAPPLVPLNTKPPLVPPDTSRPKAGPKLASIGGTVVDSRTGKPVWNARVRVDSDVSWLAVDPQNGRFRSYKIPVGKRKVVVTAKGYHSQETQVTVNEDGGTVEVKLAPNAEIKPGTIRGSVKSLRGKALRQATILIPQLDKTLHPAKDGGFSVSLKPGEYKVIISAQGYRTQRKTFRVVEGETQIWNVELHR